jgi:hypothetical protein
MPTSPFTSHALAPASALHRTTAIIALIAVAAIVLTVIIVLASSGGAARSSGTTPRGATPFTSHSAAPSNAGHGPVA